MPSLRPALCFVFGAGLGACGWLLLGAASKPASAAVPAQPDAGDQVPPANHAALAQTDAASAESKGGSASAVSPAKPDQRLHLWEALALRGGATGNLGKWVMPPGLTKAYKFLAADPDAPLNPEFAAFFDLSAEEQARVQTLLRDTLLQQREMDRAHIRPHESKFRIKQAIEIPGYSADSAILRQTYEAGMRSVLGEARYQVYRDWAGDSFKNEFPGLAGMTREYHFIPSDDDSPMQLVFASRPEGAPWTGMHSTFALTDLKKAEADSGLPLSRYFDPRPKAAAGKEAP